jgi:hypothetical protein
VLTAFSGPATALGGAGADKIALHVRQAAEHGNHQAPGAGAGVGPRFRPRVRSEAGHFTNLRRKLAKMLRHQRGVTMVFKPATRRLLGCCFLTVLFALGVSAAPRATPLTNNSAGGDFLQYFNEGPNNLNLAAGEFIRAGADSITPNGVPNPTQNIPGAVPGTTTGVATTTNTATGSPISLTLTPKSSPETPNFFGKAFAICTHNCVATATNNPANLQGPWTITFSNSTASPTSIAQTISLNPGSGEIPFVNSVTLSGTTAAPTFSWSPPLGVPVNGYRINIYQNNLETFDPSGQVVDTGLVASTNLAPGKTSYTVQASDFKIPGFGLQNNTQYTIQIDALQTRNGSITNLNNSNVSAISRAFSNFEIPSSGTLPYPLNLPTTTVTGSQVIFGFNLTVAPGVTYFIDPAIATGYIYQIGAGNPDFASVELPDIGNPTPYDLYLWNGTAFVFDTTLAANTVSDFATGGVSELEILGIDPSLGLNPSDATAFITGLTFEDAGNFTGTMTPVTTEVGAVPEPGSLTILASALFSFVFMRRRAAWRACVADQHRLRRDLAGIR